MNDEKPVSRGDAALLGLLLALGLIVGGWVLGAQIKATRLSDRYVKTLRTQYFRSPAEG